MIQIKDIIKNYKAGENTVRALKGVSINFRENEFVSILGQSGCGKTTLLNVLGGLDRYDSGEIIINGKSTKEFKDKDWDSYRNHYIGFIFQSYNLISHLTVLENVEIALSIAGLNRKEKREKAINALNKVGLGSQLHKKPNQLSGGQMQRVAIARAIVNNPKIILADEPTGALDSETSVSIMNLLKEIAGDHLIIMVTHNENLAKSYSTRIISLLDGKVINDTNPYVPTDEEISNQKQSIVLQTNTKKDSKRKKIKSQMGFFTAMHLSLKNLLTKKGRTFLTSFAGSIGIIGIALILAVSNGFTGYINKIQSDTLSGYPVTISTFTVDTESIQNAMSGIANSEEEDFSNTNQIQIKDPMITDYSKFAKYNFISPEFLNYLYQFEEEDKKLPAERQSINNIQYSYSSPLNILTKNNNEIVKVDTSVTSNPLLGAESSAFLEGLSADDFVLSQYDVIYGNYPQSINEVALVISENNTLTKELATALGIDISINNETGTYQPINFEDIAGINGKEFKVLLNDTYYTPVYEGETITKFNELNLNDSSLSQEDKLNIYNNSTNITLKISGILRIKEDSPLELYSSGIVYSPELTKEVSRLNQNSLIVTKTRETGTFYKPYNITISAGAFNNTYTSNNATETQFLIKQLFNYNLTTQQAIEYGLQGLGCSTIPTSIKIYPKNFEGKDKITNYINEWNNTEQGQNNKIFVTDATKFLSDTMGQMVNIISYVLIAFASISLVVSSIMIAIITYVSVIERTKEIGVLRSIGARKKDISRVFNAETLIIGFLSGFLGVMVSWILTFPISAIIKSVAGGSITTNLAVLSPISAIVLIVISVLLTLVAGLIPSKMAAKKDPVKALRTE